MIKKLYNLLKGYQHYFYVRLPYLDVWSKRNGLPDFLIIGAQKSGTTTLYHNLKRHRDVFMPGVKGYPEMHFFSREANWMRGVQWYKWYFANSQCIQGEKTPEYLFHQRAHARMFEVVPEAKLIIMLRNPVARAYSQWNHYNQEADWKFKEEWEVNDFETAIKKQPDLLEKGKYIDQIDHLLKFFPRDQIYIGIAERLKKNPAVEFHKVLTFLGLAPVTYSIVNVHKRNYPGPMRLETKHELEAYFRPFNQRLFEFLGEKVHEW